jgi:UDP-N-acetylglucosamine 2-epimerase
MRAVSIVGARPQYIKLAPLHRELELQGIDHQVVNTGQHYDYNLSDVFFEQLQLPKVTFNLEVGSGGASEMVGKILERSARALRQLSPDLVLVYGDTNSTLGGALAAAQLNLTLLHVEAGLRCYDLSIPEELNRVITDRISRYLFAPTRIARRNLMFEGRNKSVYITGDVLYDVVRLALPRKREAVSIVQQLGVIPGQYLLLTCHRSETVDFKENLVQLLALLRLVAEPVIFLLHPRTKKRLEEFQLVEKLLSLEHVLVLRPCGYRESLALISQARAVLTDSGGIQREAYRLRTPTLVLRDMTEWLEIFFAGGSKIVGLDRERFMTALYESQFDFSDRTICRSGASARIAKLITKLCG